MDDSSISGYHAHAKYDGDGKVTIVDIDSTNGIHVNNRRVQKKQVDHKDQIIIGSQLLDSEEFIKNVKTKYLEKKTDFSDEYKLILSQLRSFSKAKDKMNNSGNISNILRVGLVILIVLVLFLKPDLIEDDSTRIMLMIGAGLIPVIFSIFSLKGEKKRVAIDMLKFDYEEITKCPKCNKSLLNYTADYVERKGECPLGECKAKFNII
ncbi:MAG: pSer/pThr/pTyr-binding forkhead associated (FHA) protein [Halioglobus sp.]|jgi:pSer/pThr/pTyr-binding forkhead associated (FHA) protein